MVRRAAGRSERRDNGDAAQGGALYGLSKVLILGAWAISKILSRFSINLMQPVLSFGQGRLKKFLGGGGSIPNTLQGDSRHLRGHKVSYKEGH